MDIVVNGLQRHCGAGTTVGELLEKMRLHPEAVVVEVNATILAPQTVVQHPVEDGDHIEIIRFVGGG